MAELGAIICFIGCISSVYYAYKHDDNIWQFILLHIACIGSGIGLGMLIVMH